MQLFLPRYGRPDSDSPHNLSTAIIVDRQRLVGNPRPTLDAATDVFTMLRALFARIGSQRAPHALAPSFNDPRGLPGVHLGSPAPDQGQIRSDQPVPS
jgi:excinuclease UvrABC ATPase subunit